MMGLNAKLKLVLLFLASAGGLVGVSSAQAQDFTHTFTNPSFGGNPFNSDHLLAIANIDRPKVPEDPQETPTAEDLLVSQLQAQLNSTLSSNILRAIQTAQPGQSGQFTLGDTLVTFVRTATETRVTFTNSKTGETREIVIPVGSTGSAAGFGASAGNTAEGALSASGRASSFAISSSALPSAEAGLLLAPPPL